MRRSRESIPPADVQIRAGTVELAGLLRTPAPAEGLVVFAHGSGSSRRSARNNRVANVLARNRIASLLFDLLTEDEERLDRRTGHLRFDIELLGRRLIGTIEWARERHPDVPIGLFGASTGAAAALLAAAHLGPDVRAIVSRGGRPDLAGEALARVKSPALLIVGGADTAVLELNRAALAELRAEKRLEIVPGAGHLFEEPGALERVAELARDWFRAHLPNQGWETG